MMMTYIGISVQTFGGLISLMIILFIKVFRKKQIRLDQLYVRILICNTLVLFIDVISMIFNQRPGAFFRVITLTTNFTVYVLQFVLLGAAADYFIAYIEERGGSAKKARPVIWTILSVGIVLVVVSQFNHMLYSIDAQNVYRWEEWFWLYLALAAAVLAILLAVVLRFRKCLKPVEQAAFMVYLILPALSLLLQYLFYGFILVYAVSTFIVICIYIFIQAEQAGILNERKLELEKTRTAMLLSQIQPHFMFNTLQGIKYLCDHEPQRASEALDHFAYYLRCNMDSLGEEGLISFEKEIVHVQNYLYLEKMRFPHKLKIEWDISFKAFELPPLTLQPIVENAVRHGIVKKKGGGTLSIRSEKTEKNILVVISDTGVGFDVEATKDDGSAHIGIENVRRRLDIQCDGSLFIESAKGIGTRAEIILPLRRGKSENNHCR